MNEQFRKLLKDFSKVGNVQKTVILKYKGKVPDEIIELWEEYGYGSFYNGFFKVINPDEFMEVYGLLVVDTMDEIPIFTTGMGDIIAYDTSMNSFTDYFFRYGTAECMPEDNLQGIADLFEFECLGNEWFVYLPYEEAVNKYGQLEYNQCFGYTPLLSLGGYENVESLKKVDLMVHLEIISQLQEPFSWDD